MQIDALIDELARGQHGIVTRRQLLLAGVSSHSIDRRTRSCRLTPLHAGVYRAGPFAGPLAREMAAVLACGARPWTGGTTPGAAVSHRSAGALRGILVAPEKAEPIEVLVQRADRVRRPGLRVRCCRTLRADEITCVEGVPVTTPTRTLLDIAGQLAPPELERAIARALRAGSTDLEAVRDMSVRHSGHPGNGALSRLLAVEGGPQLTRSEAEVQFLALVRAAGLPAPAVNVRVGRYEVDFLWRQHRVIVEVDGFAFHSSSAAFQGDRRRDADLTAAGYRVIRFTWQQITEQPERTLVILAQTLFRSLLNADSGS